jgi:CHAD domain-containing protein
MIPFEQLLSDSILKKFQKNYKKFTTILENYLKNPNEKNIHDIRVIIRRLDACKTILPKKISNKNNLKKFRSTYKKFFKTNSNIRDVDVIYQKLVKFSSNPAVSVILKNLQKERKQNLKKAYEIGNELQNYNKIKLKKNKISAYEIKQNYDKSTLELDDEIQKKIPIVIESSKAISELHELRKDCKKLRYLLELYPTSKQSSDYIMKLKKIQDQIGIIHDNDITIEFLKNTKNTDLSEILNKEILEREKNYSSIVNFLQT